MVNKYNFFANTTLRYLYNIFNNQKTLVNAILYVIEIDLKVLEIVHFDHTRIQCEFAGAPIHTNSSRLHVHTVTICNF